MEPEKDVVVLCELYVLCGKDFKGFYPWRLCGFARDRFLFFNSESSVAFFTSLTVTQDFTGDPVAYFAGTAAASLPMKDAVDLTIECLAHGQWVACRLLAVQICAG